MVAALEARGERRLEIALAQRRFHDSGSPLLYADVIAWFTDGSRQNDRVQAYIDDAGEEIGSEHEFVDDPVEEAIDQARLPWRSASRR